MMTRGLSALDIVIIIVLIIVAAIVIYLLAPLIIAIIIIAAGYFIYRWYKAHGHSGITPTKRQLGQSDSVTKLSSSMRVCQKLSVKRLF